MPIQLMVSRHWRWTTLLVLGGIGLTIRLGFWQVDRYHQNKSFADHLTAMQSASQLTLSGRIAPPGLIDMEYRKVQATGIFDFVHQIAVRNQIWVQTWGNDVGFILITPLVFPDGSAVLVDRGWIPLAEDSPASWDKYDQNGEVRVEGIIRLPAVPGIGGKADPTLGPGERSMAFWNLVNIPRLQEQIPYPLLPVYIEQAPDPGDDGMPYRKLPTPELSAADINIGYATMWFAFSVLLFAGYPLYLRKQSNT